MRRFAGLCLSGPSPGETTVLKFRHPLEQHQLGKVILKEVNCHLEKRELLLKGGTIVDATIISAPTSTNNKAGERGPEMDQTKKGNEWHFGMKMHIGVDETFGVIRSMDATQAITHGITQTEHLLHGNEECCWGDAGYQGVEKREEFVGKEFDWHIASRPGKRKQMSGIELKLEQIKASMRAKVEHPFCRIQQQFGYAKVRYHGLAKNDNRLQVLAAFSNLLTWQITGKKKPGSQGKLATQRQYTGIIALCGY